MTDHQKWLAERKKGVGASDIHQVLNLEPYGCARRLFYEKVGFPPDYESEDKLIFRRGKQMEPIILDMLKEEHADLDIKTAAESKQGAVGHHRASPDGYAYERRTGSGMVIESKTAGERAWRKMIAEGLPDSYIVQLQWSMHVCGVQRGLFAVLWADAWKFRSWIQERNQPMIDELVEAVDAFWARVKRAKEHNTIEQAPERLEPSDSRCQRCIWRTSCQGRALLEAAGDKGEMRNDVVMLTGALARQMESAVERFLSLRELANEATEMLEAAKAEIKAAMGDRTAVEVNGARVYNRVVVSKRVDVTALKQKYKDVYEAVAKDSVSQPLRAYGI